MSSSLTVLATVLARQTYTEIAASALITYDVLLTLPMEVALVWRGTWGVPAALYIINRYGVMAHSLWVVAVAPNIPSDVGGWFEIYCKFWNVFAAWSIPLVTLLTEALLTMRVTAFYGRRVASLALWAMYLLCASASITVMTLGVLDTQTPQPTVAADCLNSLASPEPGCLGTIPQNPHQCNGGMVEWTWAFWAPGMVMELVLVCATLVRSLEFWRRGAQSRLITIITQDNCLYFCCIFALMVANLVICAISSRSVEFGIITEMTLCINSILAGRIFLHLRAERGEPGAAETQETEEITDSTGLWINSRI